MKAIRYSGGLLCFVVCLCVAGVITGCRKTNVKTDGLGWDVTVHESVDVYDGQLGSDEYIKDAVRKLLNGAYTFSEKPAVDSLLDHNRAYFDREDLAWDWLEGDFNNPGYATLLIYRRTPAIRQTVEQAEIYPMQPADEEYMMAGFKFDDASLWEKVTEANLGEQLIFMVNGKLIYAPHVQDSITEGAASLILNPENASQLLPADVISAVIKKK